jgi:hypothetical protein
MKSGFADGDGRQDGWAFHPKQYLYFAVPDLEATLDTAIVAMPCGERMFYVRDPLGSRICWVDERTLFMGLLGNTSLEKVRNR